MSDEVQSEQSTVEGPDCETARDPQIDIEVDSSLDGQDVRTIDAAVEANAWDEVSLAGLGPVGGGWGGATPPVNRAQAIGVRNGLRVTSRNRSTRPHWLRASHQLAPLRRSRPFQRFIPHTQMDRTAAQIANLLGVVGWSGGVLERRLNGYRVQLLYRTNVGGNHYNHVHVGSRV